MIQLPLSKLSTILQSVSNSCEIKWIVIDRTLSINSLLGVCIIKTYSNYCFNEKGIHGFILKYGADDCINYPSEP